jgi:hypothetical protein
MRFKVRQPTYNGNWLHGSIVKVDKRARVITIEINGKRGDYKVDEDTQFIGPREEVCRQGIKDDRVVEGASVFVVVSRKMLKEVHLPYRNQIGK